MNGRSERIRTSGPCLPNAVLYQAELHSDRRRGRRYRRPYTRLRNRKPRAGRRSGAGPAVSSRASMAEVDDLEQGALLRAVGEEAEGVARDGAVVARPRRRVSRKAPCRSCSAMALVEIAVAPARAPRACGARSARSSSSPRRKARTTGRVILPSRKSSPTVLPSSACARRIVEHVVDSWKAMPRLRP